MEKELQTRSGGKCELCTASGDMSPYEVAGSEAEEALSHILICSSCRVGIEAPLGQVNHWRCLNDSMWSEVPAVQVMAWRILNAIKEEGWPQELLDMFYLDDEVLAWAQSTGNKEDKVFHKDSNGALLQVGDTVTLIKDLNVKGASFTAKRGTAVRRIRLVSGNAEQIEGKVDGQDIVILTQFVKKTG